MAQRSLLSLAYEENTGMKGTENSAGWMQVFWLVDVNSNYLCNMKQKVNLEGVNSGD